MTAAVERVFHDGATRCISARAAVVFRRLWFIHPLSAETYRYYKEAHGIPRSAV